MRFSQELTSLLARFGDLTSIPKLENTHNNLKLLFNLFPGRDASIIVKERTKPPVSNYATQVSNINTQTPPACSAGGVFQAILLQQVKADQPSHADQAYGHTEYRSKYRKVPASLALSSYHPR